MKILLLKQFCSIFSEVFHFKHTFWCWAAVPTSVNLVTSNVVIFRWYETSIYSTQLKELKGFYKQLHKEGSVAYADTDEILYICNATSPFVPPEIKLVLFAQ